jgi:hypothetical protein
MQSEDQTTHVMNKQGVELAELAREYGVLREYFAQFLKNPERTTRFFRSLDPMTWFEDLKVEATKVGAVLHLIPRLVVDYRVPHEHAVRLASGIDDVKDSGVKEMIHKTIYNEYGKKCKGVANLGYLYQLPEKRKEVKETIVLVKWNPAEHTTASCAQVAEWALGQGLQKTLPHVVFAIGAQRKNLELPQSKHFSIGESTGCTVDEHSHRICEIQSTGLPDVTTPYVIKNGSTWLAFRR